MSALEKVTQPNIKLLNLIDIGAGEILRAEEGNELAVRTQYRIRPQVRRDFLRLILKDLSPRGFKGMIMRKSQLDCLIQINVGRALCVSSRGEK